MAALFDDLNGDWVCQFDAGPIILVDGEEMQACFNCGEPVPLRFGGYCNGCRALADVPLVESEADILYRQLQEAKAIGRRARAAGLAFWPTPNLPDLGWVLAACLVFGIGAAHAAPPPPNSEEAEILQGYGEWISHQNRGVGGWCCDVSDGRLVDVRTAGDHYEVHFLHPETLTARRKPREWEPVAADAILRNKDGTPITSPFGMAMAWWYDPGHREGPAHVHCFVQGFQS